MRRAREGAASRDGVNMNIPEAVDGWYRRARSETTSSLVLALLVLVLARGVVFATLLPFPSSPAELATVTYSWRAAHGQLTPGNQLAVPAPLSDLASVTTSQTNTFGPASVERPLVPSAFHLAGVMVFFLLQFLAPGMGLLVLRLVSTLLAAAVVWLAFEMTRRLAPRNQTAQLVVPVIVALNPQLSVVASQADPTALYVFGFTALIVLLMGVFAGAPNIKRLYPLTAATVLFAIPADRVLVVGLAVLVLVTAYRGWFGRSPIGRALAIGAVWLLALLFVWRSVIPDVIARLAPSLSGSPFVPSFGTDIGPYYVTASAVLRGFIGLPGDPGGWALYPLRGLLLSVWVIAGLVAAAGVSVLAYRGVQTGLAATGSRFELPAEMKITGLIFTGLIVLTALSGISPTDQLMGPIPGTTAGQFGPLAELAIPYLQTLAFAGLVILAVWFLNRNWTAAKTLARTVDRDRAYALTGMVLVALYVSLVQPPARPAIPGFAIVAIAPATYLLVVGVQALWPKLERSVNFLLVTFLTLFGITLLATVSWVFSGVGDVFGVAQQVPLVASWFGAILSVGLIWAGVRVAQDISALGRTGTTHPSSGDAATTQPPEAVGYRGPETERSDS